MATHSSTLAWRIPETEEPIRLHGVAKCWARLSDSTFFATRAVPCRGPLSMGFFGQEYWSGWPFPPPVGGSS